MPDFAVLRTLVWSAESGEILFSDFTVAPSLETLTCTTRYDSGELNL